MSEIIVRRLTTDHINYYLDLIHEGKLTFAEVDTFNAYKRHMAQHPDSIIGAFVEQTSDGEVIGHKLIGGMVIIYTPLFTTFSHLVVDEKYRRKGVATTLVNTARDSVNKAGTGAIVCYVEDENDGSHQLFESLNFKVWPRSVRSVIYQGGEIVY